MDRLITLKNLQLLLGHCRCCDVRDELNKKYGNVYSRIDRYCNDKCSIGLKLQEVGDQLIEDTRKKRALKNRVSEEPQLQKPAVAAPM